MILRFSKKMFYGWTCFQILLINVTTSAPSQNASQVATSEPLKCSRDYHCPSSCDVCRKGICTHPLNLACSRDYHCPKCEVCLNGTCTNGNRRENACTPEDAWKTCLHVEKCDDYGKCVRNICNEDEECGERAECKSGKCFYF